MYDRLLAIDDLTRPDHSFIDPTDACHYMGEYTARGGFGASATNNLIVNLKKPMDRRGRAEWRYKEEAIRTVADDLRRILGRPGIESATFVPVPPSKAITDPNYDPRLAQILVRMGEGLNSDVRELVLQRDSLPASHESNERTSIEDLIANYYIDESKVQPTPRAIVIFDDMLTTGRHFKAVKAVLAARFPEHRYFGLFIARRVPNTDDLAAFL